MAYESSAPPPSCLPPPPGCTVSTDPRPPTTSMRVNDGSGPFWGKGAFGPLPKYWHFASTTCRQRLQLAGRVYLWCTVSTDPRPPGVCTALCGRQCLQTTDRNSYDPRVNGRGIRVNGVAFGVKCAYSCILGAFGPRPGATRPPRGVLRTPGGGARQGGGPDGGGGGRALIYHIYIYIYIYIYPLMYTPLPNSRWLPAEKKVFPTHPKPATTTNNMNTHSHLRNYFAYSAMRLLTSPW